MRTVLFLLRKEFLQIFRNRGMLRIIIVLPVLQLLVLSNAATFEVRNTDFVLLDEDRSRMSTDIAEHLQASGYFTLVERVASSRQADVAILRGDAGMILRIPQHFERDFVTTGSAGVQFVLNAQDGATVGVVQAYAGQILASYNRDVIAEVGFPASATAAVSRIEMRPSLWYNPELNYITYMVPGILVLLVTMIGTFLTAMNIVREKETGTIEQLNVTPIKKWHFIVGKLLPFWIIALVELAVGLVIARVVFDVPMLGNLVLVFALAGVYMLVMLGIGLFVSTATDTQQQAMFLAWFIMVVFILMSGLFTPIESMPEWAQRMALLNPVAHFIEIMRRVLLKGAGFAAIQTQFWTLSAYAAVVLTLAIRKYRKITA